MVKVWWSSLLTGTELRHLGFHLLHLTRGLTLEPHWEISPQTPKIAPSPLQFYFHHRPILISIGDSFLIVSSSYTYIDDQKQRLPAAS